MFVFNIISSDPSVMDKTELASFPCFPAHARIYNVPPSRGIWVLLCVDRTRSALSPRSN